MTEGQKSEVTKALAACSHKALNDLLIFIWLSLMMSVYLIGNKRYFFSLSIIAASTLVYLENTPASMSNSSQKQKISITVDLQLLEEIDRLTKNRSTA